MAIHAIAFEERSWGPLAAWYNAFCAPHHNTKMQWTCASEVLDKSHSNRSVSLSASPKLQFVPLVTCVCLEAACDSTSDGCGNITRKAVVQ